VLSLVFSHFLPDLFSQIGAQPFPAPIMVCLWFPPVMLAAATVFCVAALASPAWRARLKWRLPAFREASLSQLAAAIALMLKNGTTLPEALALAEVIEAGSPAARTLAQWRSLVEGGHGKPSQWTITAHPFPPLFLWLVNKGGEDVAAGFQKAADIFHSRASYRIEMALYGALPISILLLGQMVLWQVFPLFRAMIWMMNMLGAAGGD
jgi:type II secretory pathway component PulF